VSQCVGLGGIFRQLMDDVGSGGKRREERKKEKRWWKNSRSSGVQTVLYMYELPPIYSNPEGRKMCAE
jgi:hypothetical protein